MKKKRLAALAVALALVLSLSVSVLALTGMSLGEWISIGFNKGDFPDYTYAEWESMSIDERRAALEAPVIKYRGTPHFTDDFLSDSKSSHNAYEGFVNGYSVVGGVIPNIASSVYLETMGQADLRLGFYNDDYNDTVAGELNYDFLDYIQKYPYVGQDTPSTAYKFSNGYYVDWEPLLIGSGPNNFAVGDVIHSCKKYGLRFYLHDETGKIIDMVDHKGFNAYTPLIICDICGGALFDNFTITYDGQYYFDYYPWDYPHTKYKDVRQSSTYGFPWWSQYGAPTAEPVVTDPVATGTDENGIEIQFNINSDGVTYEGNTYNYNDDNSVTINGNTYHITVNPADVNEDYYNQFLQQVINNYYNYYGTDSTPFDDKDIISAVKSVFTSLETFRSYCYSQLKQIGDYIFDGFNSMRSSMKTIIDNLKDILKQLKKINKSVGELTEEQEEKNKSDWADLISDFKDKVGWASLDKSMRNIQIAFFGQREYSVHSETGEIQVQILQKNAAPLASSMPNLSITYMGQSYNLYSCVAYFGGDIDPIKQFISLFLWVGFILSVFRSIPSILGGVGALQKDTHFLSKDGD